MCNARVFDVKKRSFNNDDFGRNFLDCFATLAMTCAVVIARSEATKHRVYRGEANPGSINTKKTLNCNQ